MNFDLFPTRDLEQLVAGYDALVNLHRYFRELALGPLRRTLVTRRGELQDVAEQYGRCTCSMCWGDLVGARERHEAAKAKLEATARPHNQAVELAEMWRNAARKVLQQRRSVVFYNPTLYLTLS